MDTAILTNPGIQYGFAFVCLVLISVLVWVLKNVFKLFRENHSVIRDNTHSNTALRDCIDESRKDGDRRAVAVYEMAKTLEHVATLLHARPCLLTTDDEEIRPEKEPSLKKPR